MTAADWVAEAEADAAAAAERAGVVIRDVGTPDELDVLRDTMRDIWGPDVVPPRNLLRGMAIGGGCLLVAHRDGAPIGFALGWLGWSDGVHLHSHQVGVTSGARAGGVGLALKLAQRARCLQQGIVEMRWTFDPLLASNAAFNLVRLGARVVAFFPHCYGDRRDAFNTGEVTDRVEVAWRLDQPVGGTTRVPGAGEWLLAIPPDYAIMRVTDVARATGERARVGTALSHVFDSGGAVVGFGDGGYVVRSAP